MFLFYTIILIYTCRQEHKTNVSELLVFNFSFLSFKSCPFFFFYRPEVRQLKCFLMLEKKKKNTRRNNSDGAAYEVTCIWTFFRQFSFPDLCLHPEETKDLGFQEADAQGKKDPAQFFSAKWSCNTCVWPEESSRGHVVSSRTGIYLIRLNTQGLNCNTWTFHLACKHKVNGCVVNYTPIHMCAESDGGKGQRGIGTGDPG